MASISELLKKLHSAPTKEYDKVLGEIVNQILGEEFRPTLEKENFGSIVELMLVIPEDRFEEFVNKYKDVLENKFREAGAIELGRLYEGLTKPKRKIISINFRPVITKRFSTFGLEDIVKMLYNVIPATRETVLNQYKETMMRPDFSKTILETPLDILGEFLSLAPESIRASLIKRHSKTFLSDEFVEKIKKADPEERAKVLRWLPMEMAKEIMSKISS